MTIAGDLQNMLAAQIERDPNDMDALVRVVFDFLLDGPTIGWLAHELDGDVSGAYVDAVSELKLKIIPKPDSAPQSE